MSFIIWFNTHAHFKDSDLFLVKQRKGFLESFLSYARSLNVFSTINWNLILIIFNRHNRYKYSTKKAGCSRFFNFQL